MELIITRKASVASVLATLVLAFEKTNNYYYSDKYYVTWIGSRDIILKAVQVNKKNKGEGYAFQVKAFDKHKAIFLENDHYYLNQFTTIKELAKKSKSILFATEPSEKADVFFAYLYKYLNLELPFTRLPLFSLDKKSLEKAFAKKMHYWQKLCLFDKPLQKDLVYTFLSDKLSYKLKQIVNSSAGPSCLISFFLISFVYQKQKEFQSLGRKAKYSVSVRVLINEQEYDSNYTKKYKNRQSALVVLNKILKSKSLSISKVQREVLSTQRPLFFDFITLCKKAYKQYGILYKETLSILKTLYYQGFLSYPITLYRYLPVKFKKGIPEVLSQIRDYSDFKYQMIFIKSKNLNYKGILDNSSSSKWPLLARGQIPKGLGVKQKAIYNLLIEQIILCFKPFEEKQQKKVQISLDSNKHYLEFYLISKDNFSVVASNSFKAYNIVDSFKDEFFSSKSKIQVKSALVEKTKVRKNCFSSANSVLKSLERDFLQFLKTRGISQNELCFFEDFFKRAVLCLDSLIYSKILKTSKAGVTLNGEVAKLFKGLDYNISEFLQRVFELEILFYRYTKTDIDKANLDKKVNELVGFFNNTKKVYSQENKSTLCPLCQKHNLEFYLDRVICQNKECKWSLKRQVSGVYLSVSDVNQLIQKRKSSSLFEFTISKHSKVKGYLRLNKNCELQYEFI